MKVNRKPEISDFSMSFMVLTPSVLDFSPLAVRIMVRWPRIYSPGRIFVAPS